MKLNHIGIAVKDVAAAKALFDLLGFGSSETEDVPEQGVRTHFLPLPKADTRLELLEVTDPDGTVAQFIKKRGPGIHHLSFELESGELDRICGKLSAQGFRLVYDRPQSGAHAMRINFIHPASTGGILIELMEPSKAKTK